MRILIANSTRRRVGGAEEYLARLVSGLCDRGHAIAFLHDVHHAGGPDEIPLPPQTPVWNAYGTGLADALCALREWSPDVVYCNGMSTAALEQALSLVGPCIFSAHGYWGTCISGSKSFALPTAQPCHRQLGVGCLACYYPRRCGGLSPVTMLRDFSEQSQRLRVLEQYDAVIVHSEYMSREYAAHGIATDTIYYPQLGPTARAARRELTESGTRRLLFMGRMTKLKGVDVLIDALGIAQRAMGGPLHLTLAGDGPTRHDSESIASRMREQSPDTTFEFVGWLDERRRADILATHDLLVVPSTWPEPFGMVGLEAAAYGMPSVAFAVGGIPEWLRSGYNGVLAPSEPPTVSGLASAIVAALGNRESYRKSSEAARAVFEEFASRDAVSELIAVFERVRARASIGAR